MSASEGEAIGIMDSAYFVSRSELLSWLNDFLKLDYTKIEQTCSGAAACQLMDALYPGRVPLHKVNFNAKYDYEYIKNYKVLQDVFNQIGVNKVVEVNRLIKGKYQDNLEFTQWMKRYFDIHYNGQEYDAVARRKGVAPKSTGSSNTTTTATTATGTVTRSTAPGGGGGGSGVSSSNSNFSTGGAGAVASTTAAINTSGSSSDSASRKRPPSASQSRTASKPPLSATATGPQSGQGDSAKRIKELQEELAQLTLTVDGLEKERDFYFGKLRDIEIYCQQNEEGGSTFLAEIQKILYATDDQPTETTEAPAQ